MTPADPTALAEAVATVRSETDLIPIEQLVPIQFGSAGELLARHFLAMLDAGELVRVRGLEWEDSATDDRPSAQTPFGAILLDFSGIGVRVIYPIGPNEKFETEVGAKKGAEQWYRSRLAAALEPLLPEVR